MSKPWHPRLVPGAALRPKRRQPAIGAGEIRLVVLGGAFLGLVYASIPGVGAYLDGGRQVAEPWAVQVIDGDTFDYRGQRIRIADIDTPETSPPRCAHEAELGARATRRLRTLLAEGPFELASIDRDEDRYGRKLRLVRRDGRSIGGRLVAEGLARPYHGGPRRGWCGGGGEV